ncbi:MAG: hypothetical protein ACXABK_00585, partial [Candidatus Heimdallarchaeaceae archaeon]
GASEKKAEGIFEYLKKENIPCELVGKVIPRSGVIRKDNEDIPEPKEDEIITALENLEKNKLETE